MIKYKAIYLFLHFLRAGQSDYGGGRSSINLYFQGAFYYPFHQVIRAISFGVIAGSAITLAAILFKLIDMFKIKKR